jgi:pimeloyl-ACP methyl ester carboxylesterase
MKTIAVNGTLRLYDEEGAGPPVVLVHGTASSSRQWRTLGELLRDRYRVISPDLGLGVSSGGEPRPGAFSFDEDCALVSALIESFDGNVRLLGHSYGGVVAAKVALTKRAAISKLILIEPSCFHLLVETGQVAEKSEILHLREQQQGLYAAGDLEPSARTFIDYWMGPEAWSSMPERRRQMILSSLPKWPHDWHGTLAHVTRLNDYRGLAVPTLLMRAKDTRRPSFRIVDLLSGVLPNREIAEVERGGHMSPLTNPDAVNPLVARFLDKSA